MPDTLPVLKRALNEIHERGWTRRFSHGPGTPLNIRSAVSKACSDITLNGKEFYVLYTATIAVIMSHLGTGILNWESGPPQRSQAQVEQVFADLINGLEKS